MGLKIIFTEIPNFHFLEKSENVGIIQEILNELGYDIGRSGVDKIFGNDTKKALEQFIKEGTIKKDGLIGPKTLYALSDKAQIQADGYVPLSWEKLHQERNAWSNFTHQTIDNLFDNSFSQCQDITRFRSDYNSLNRKQKINVWGELISAICKFESGWKLNSWMEENMGTDPVTHKKVRSEGLLQLSYQDKLSYPGLPCRFDWNTDKNLNEDDLNKTIFNPEINLEFGINILAKQIRDRNKIALSNGVYWAVIKDGGKYSRINEIISCVENLKL